MAVIAGKSPTTISASQYVDQARRRFLTRNRRRFTALRQQFGRESLRLGDTLYLNGDGIDRLLERIEPLLKASHIGHFPRSWPLLNATHQRDGDGRQRADHCYDDHCYD